MKWRPEHVIKGRHIAIMYRNLEITNTKYVKSLKMMMMVKVVGGGGGGGEDGYG